MKTVKINESVYVKQYEDNSIVIVEHDKFSGETNKVFLEKETFEKIKEEF